MPQAASTTAPARQTILHGFAALTQTCQRMTCSGPIVHYTFRLLESSPPNEPLMADQIVIAEKTSQAKDIRAAVGSRYGDILPAEGHLFGFQEDAMSIRDRNVIGVDNLLWGSDYPHVEATFPRSHQIIEEVLKDCTEEEKAKIAGGNAVRIY